MSKFVAFGLRQIKDPAYFNEAGRELLPGLVGLEVVAVGPEQLECRLQILPQHMAVNDFLHGATVVTLADTACGYGTIASLPEGAQGHATVELKTNFVGTAREGHALCVARPVHLGRTTQVWDATVTHEETGRSLAHFRCTQMILWGS